MNPTASILIPHFNNPALIGPCLESLRNLAPESPPHEVVVVDDGSTDYSVEWIRREHPEVRVVESEVNGGFVKAIHRGVAQSGGEILVFLNNDTWVEPDWLTCLVEPIAEGRTTGAAGSILLDWEGKSATFKGGKVNILGYGFEDRGDLPDPAGDPIPQLFVCGGAMAIGRRLFEEVGGFDESYGMIYEDVDLGWRLNRMGHDCQLIPGSRVGHRTHASLGRQSFEGKGRYYIGNPIRTVFKNWDEEDFLEHIGMVITLAEARERICLLGGTVDRGVFSKWFGRSESTPIVAALVNEEEANRTHAAQRALILKHAKRSTRDLLQTFNPDPTRRWAFDEEQHRLLEEKGYWRLEDRLFAKMGWR